MESPLSLHKLAVAAIGTMVFTLSLTSTAESGGGPSSASQATAAQAASQPGPASTAVGNPQPPSGTSGPANGGVLLKMKQPTLYVLVYAGDPATTNFLAYEVAAILQPYAIQESTPRSLRPSNAYVGNWITPEPAWALTDFATQCQNDTNTIGALIIYDVENNAGTSSYLFYQRGWTYLYAHAALVSCAQIPTAAPVSTFAKGTALTSLAGQRIVSGVPAPNATPLTGDIKPILSPPTVTNDQKTIQKTTKCSGTKSSINDINGTRPPSPCPVTEIDYQKQRTKTDTAPTATSPPLETVQVTQNTTWIPSMRVEWQTTHELSGQKDNGLVPFLTFAALGAYLAARQETVQNTTTVMLPNVPGTTNTGTTSYAHQTSLNNSTLPFGLALLGTSFSQLGSGSVGGLNQSDMLKYAAAHLAKQLALQLRAEWYNNTTGMLNQTFDFSQWGPLPKATPEPASQSHP
jgi:hypothetical protein